MNVGVLADTHDRLPAVDAALALFRRRSVDTVVHAGDVVAPFAAKRLLSWEGPLHVVYGNNDGEREGLKTLLPQIQDGPFLLALGGRKILIHHAWDGCPRALVAQADIVITGHTHEPVNQQSEGRLLLNPGECCGWVTGRCTAALLDTDSLSAEIVEVPL